MRQLLGEMFRRVMRAYSLEDYHPHETDPVPYGAPAGYCFRCEQQATGLAWDPQTGEALCLGPGGCYEQSEIAHRRFPYSSIH